MAKPGPKCTECGSPTTLHQYPEQYAGIWECSNLECGASGSCEHEKRHVETTEDAPTGPLDNPRKYAIYVCDDCLCAIPLDEAEPAEDAHDAMVDAQIEGMRESDV